MWSLFCNRRALLIVTLMGSLLLASSYLFLIKEDALTASHEDELRTVIAHYLAVRRNALSTLDTSELETVATDRELANIISQINLGSGITIHKTFTISEFFVSEYSSEHARVFVLVDNSNVYKINPRTGERILHNNDQEGWFCTLLKIDGVWKVAGTESPR